MDNQDLLTRLILVFLLIALNAFFVAAEFSLVSVRRTRVSQLVAAGDVPAQTVQSLQRSLDRLLSTTQLGITLSSLALGWIGESTMTVFVRKLLSFLPFSLNWQNLLSHGFSLCLAFLIVAYLQIVFGELYPKSLALIYAEPMARLLAAPIGVISQIFKPFIGILNQSTRFLLVLTRIPEVDLQRSNRVTCEELQLIISMEGELTGLEAAERKILNNVFQFGEITAAEIMVPHNRLIAIPSTATFQELLLNVVNSGYSCYPVAGDSGDDIRGLIDFKDLALPLAEGQLNLTTPIKPWLKPVRFFPETTPLNELLTVMQESFLKMVIIVDEFGRTAGLLTLKDLIGEILGTFPPSDQSGTLEYQLLDESTFLVQAQMNLEDVNKALNLSLPLADEYQTLAGFVLHHWQKIPKVGEQLYYQNLEFTIISKVGPRLEQIKIYRQQLSS
ncbi:magnesium and cobalt efflux protein CorC [Microcystis aeruginosa NIES-2520]|jgi:CBS domain containing-hemolysin-like protein|uniref:Magnesium and cobalt efflux protein CorC n=3 Tax=Microcystis TaxID=1125 RepID=A0A5A5RJ76_MICAE|nr:MULTISPECIES: hemolysin family protein [Microcystis]MCA2669291.1 HlyC/CorC family transporter [Microcystis sp. M045S2]MCA2715438.1 HlyC/CorC family transporter [Microcystis sp. M172S2]MCA2805806.1 HlyC/CorC family transporter [Microcystis sp. M114S2]MCA2836018.1 HlyC/CorC family transporter [Microcystis sp. M007S1]MCA2837534.1 HlyC/CorC family transporter [Microcystis sp. M078S1]